MKLLSNWGFSLESWKGQRGEYLFLVQLLWMLGVLVLPVYRPTWLEMQPPWLYGVWAIALLLGISGAVFIGKGLLDLGTNLTPLPYPKPEGELVQSGIYGIVRHPLYTGLLLMAKAWAIRHLSLSHLVAVLIGFLLLNVKANREEVWLTEKYPDYASYQQRVKKLIPWVY